MTREGSDRMTGAPSPVWTRLWVLVLVLAPMVPAACAREQEAQSEIGRAAGGHQASAPDAPAAEVLSSDNPQEPEVRLIDSGKEPRHALRFRAKKGQTENMTIAMTMSMCTRMGDRSPKPQELPTMIMNAGVTVTDVLDNGDMRYEFRFTRAEVEQDAEQDSETVKQIEESLATLDGLSGWSVVSSRGVTRSAKINLPERIGPQERQLLESLEQNIKQLTLPFPEDPVGLGARWQHLTNYTFGSMNLTQTTTYELTDSHAVAVVSAEDLRGITCNVTMKQKAPRQTVTTPAGVQVEVLSLESTGRGVVESDLTNLVPRASSVKTSSKIETSLTPDGIMTLDMSIDVKIGGDKSEVLARLAGERKAMRASQDIDNLGRAVVMFQLNEHRLPDKEEWPRFLFEGSKNHPSPYLDPGGFESHDAIKDPWGTPYSYEKLGAGKFEILSYGADGVPGGIGQDADVTGSRRDPK